MLSVPVAPVAVAASGATTTDPRRYTRVRRPIDLFLLGRTAEEFFFGMR
jgi:hypothetical protein